MKQRNMEHELGLDFLRVVEAAGIASAKTMGQGDRKFSDHAAVEAMRETMDTVPMRGEIVIGEGERDDAPMLYIGEKVGLGHKADAEDADLFPEVDIAVDPLEGTNLCATGSSNAIAVMACSEKGGLLRAPWVQCFAPSSEECSNRFVRQRIDPRVLETGEHRVIGVSGRPAGHHDFALRVRHRDVLDQPCNRPACEPVWRLVQAVQEHDRGTGFELPLEEVFIQSPIRLAARRAEKMWQPGRRLHGGWMW